MTRTSTKNPKSELDRLKTLVRRFLKETRSVPYRPVDCDQCRVLDLLEELKAVTAMRTRSAH